jgi:hypothetical protein
MAFIDELSTKFTKMVKKIGEKSEELVGLGKLNYEIYKEEDTVKKLYSKIGQVVYEAYSKENNSINVIYNLCKEIDSRRERIESLKRDADDIKAGKSSGGTTAEASTGDNDDVEKQREEAQQTPQEDSTRPANHDEQPQQTRREERPEQIPENEQAHQ